MAKFNQRVANRKGVILGAAFFSASLGLTAFAASDSIKTAEEEKLADASIEGQACVAVFEEGGQLFSALDAYLFTDGLQEARTSVADAVDAHSPLADAISEDAEGSETASIAGNIDAAVVMLDSEMFRGVLPEDNPENLASELDTEWLALSTVGIEQEELITHCAFEGVFLDENYEPSRSEPVDLTQPVEVF